MENDSPLNSLILLATLKKDEASNTAVLSDFLSGRLEKRGVVCSTVKLVESNVLPGTYSDMGPGDGWPAILEKIESADIIVFAAPIWWGNYSSEMQKVIERLDEVHDEILAGKPSRLDGKVAGVVITGDSDGAEQLIGHFANFFNAVGLIFPPYATLSVLWDGQAKGKKTSRLDLLKKYEEEYAQTADKMADQLIKYAGAAV